jgi:hypothetical protein
MKIILNGLELQKQAAGKLTVRQVLEEIQGEINSSGRILVRAVLDNGPLQENWLDDPRVNTSVDRVSTLDLVIDEPQRLAKQMLADAEALLSEMTVQTDELARKYRVGDDVVAHNELAGMLDKLKLIVKGMDVTTRHAARLYPLNEVRNRVKTSAEDLTPVLDRILTAQERGDNVALADEIEYELPGCIRAWHTLVDEARRIVQETDTAN